MGAKGPVIVFPTEGCGGFLLRQRCTYVIPLLNYTIFFYPLILVVEDFMTPLIAGVDGCDDIVKRESYLATVNETLKSIAVL